MHGTVYTELEKFVKEKHGDGAWSEILTAANLGERTWETLRGYPDDEILAILQAASSITGQEIPVILEAFGRFMAPDLLKLYWALIAKDWRTLDVIEHAEENIHSVVRIDHPEARPPKLKCKRLGPGEVRLTYGSQRKLCMLAKGIAHGIADHYGERIEITDEACMGKGNPRCIISIRLLQP